MLVTETSKYAKLVKLKVGKWGICISSNASLESSVELNR